MAFLLQIYNTDLSRVTNCDNLDTAAALFSSIYGSVLNQHAPIKTYQNRTNYLPWLSDETKLLMTQRDLAKENATQTGDSSQLDEYKRLRNLVKSRLNSDKINHYKNNFHNPNQSISSLWSTAYQFLGQTKNLTPVQLVVDGKPITSPRSMANAFNNIFIKKVQDLKNGISGQIIEDPLSRLSRWLDQRQNPIPLFNFHQITTEKIRKIIKKLKGKRSCGIDMIDGYSIKLAAPLIEEVLLHLVNLSIGKSHYPKYWKVSKIIPLYKNRWGELSASIKYHICEHDM